MYLQTYFRVSKWPTNQVAWVENLDIGYSTLALIQQLARVFALAHSHRKFVYSISVHLTKLDNVHVKHRSET